MNVVIAGGTGFLGTPLATALRAAGHDVTLLTRGSAGAGRVAWIPDGTAGDWARSLDGADAAVNLSGESIASGRWTPKRKEAIRNSRILATRSLVAAMLQAQKPPAVFVSGSAVGYYGPRGDEPLIEESPAGTDFLAQVCRDWEAEAQRAADLTRVVLLRTGLVLAANGGALPQIVLPFRMFAGGQTGSGEQYWSWIHRADWVGIVVWALQHAAVSGPINLTAPNPVKNREFAETVGRVLHRPSLLPAPAFALRTALGEMADALLLTGQRVLPSKVEADGYAFQHDELEPALRDLLT